MTKNKCTTALYKILKGLQLHGKPYFYNTRQIWSDNQNRAVTLHSISKLEINPETGKKKSVQLYEAPSIIRVAMFIRDIWFLENHWELPTDDEKWNEIRKTLPALNTDNFS